MKIKKIIFCLLISLLVTPVVKAASVSVKSSASSVTKGSTVTITATISSEAGIYTTSGTLSCSGAGVSASTDMSSEDLNTKDTYKTFSFSVKPTSSGTISCSTSNVRIRELSHDSEYSLNNSSAVVSVSEPAVVNKPKREYSSNNNLKSLEIEGYSLEPEFNKDTLEYNIEVPNGTEKVNINAKVEDSSASATGAGEVSVTEGVNKIEVKVEAENGNSKTYILNITVKELDPIEVKIDKKKYTIIRKEGILDPISNYEKSTIKINDEDVLCYVNSKTKNILIGLKDENGNSKYYLYDEKKKSYSEYNSMVIGGLYLNIIDMPKDNIPNGYSKVSFNYNENKLEGYQKIDKGVTYAADESVKGSDFYLIYAVNELTGKKSMYMYDSLENTVQRYNEDLILSIQKKADSYFLYMLISIALLAVSIITLTIVLIKKRGHKK